MLFVLYCGFVTSSHPALASHLWAQMGPNVLILLLGTPIRAADPCQPEGADVIGLGAV